MFRFMNLGIVNGSTIQQLQQQVVRPVVLETKDQVMQKNCEEALAKSPDGLVVSGNCPNGSRMALTLCPDYKMCSWCRSV